MILTGASNMVEHPRVRCPELVHLLAQECQAVLERAGGSGCVKDHEDDEFPLVGSILASDHADGPLKFLAANPKLAIEWHRGQLSEKPDWGVEWVPEP